MNKKFTKIPNDTFEHLVIDAGMLVDTFDPATGVYGQILGATQGGIEFSANCEWTDFGEDIDNCPNNMKQLKQLASIDATMSGTFLTLTAETLKMLAAVADIDEQDETHIVPRDVLLDGDFIDLWWVGNYSNINTGEHAGYLCIHLMNALNTSGFSMTTSKNEKGTFAFEFHGHYDMDNQELVPYELYIKSGSGAEQPSIFLNKHSVTIPADGTYQLNATVVPAGTSVTWTSSATGKATVSNAGKVTAAAAGTTIITAAITVDGVTYNDTCTIVVEDAS